MRVLFSHSYYLRFDEKQWNAMQPYAPLGTLVAAAWLRQHGFDVMLHDVMFRHSPNEIVSTLESYQPDILVIYDDGFNYLTKMCLTNMREAAFEMIRLAKQAGCVVLVSSSDSTDHYDGYLMQGADFILLGEAEQTLLELCNQIRNQKVLADTISGLAYCAGSQICRTTPRPVMRDLDALPFAAWDLVDLDAYRQAWMRSKGYFSINMNTTRGCPFKCNWCAKPIYGNRYHARSPEHVLQELNMLHHHYAFDHIWFCDDIFGLKPGWVAHFATLLKSSGMKIRFKIQSRADLLLNDEQVDALAEAGCETVWMGAESGSQKILDAMNKGITIAQIEEAVAQLKRRKIRTALFLQFGYLGETKDDIRLTLNLLRNLKPEEIGVSISYPLPGTGFYEKVKEDLQRKANWSDSDDLAMMFKGTYGPEFYKKLHRYVHTFYRRIRNRQQAAQLNLKSILKMPLYALRDLQQQKILRS
ncbi:MAG: B12-binding domain-containing radical SAM protein [Bacteroidetes bacterium]|nr:B12-binding domain-containing radical SAM protein [Bacteroidota bacterium]